MSELLHPQQYEQIKQDFDADPLRPQSRLFGQ